MPEFKVLQNLFRDITLLYVEDDPSLREQVSIFFKNLTQNLHVAENGALGLELYRQHSPDLVVTDIQMPEMDGVEMIKSIHELNPEALVVVTTAFNEVNLLTSLIDLGVDTYIKKPIEYKMLYGTLTKLGKMIRARREIEEKNQMILQQSRMAGMGDILTMVAHHWRQPLNVLALNVQEVKMLKDDGELTDAFIDDFVDKSNDVIQAMSKTIDTFYGFTNQRSGITPFDVKEALSSTLTLIDPILQEKSVAYQLDVAEGVRLASDRYSFQQALYNVISNSIEAILDHGVDKGKFKVSARLKGDDSVEVLIEDNGGGVDVDPVERIYEPYFTTKGPRAGKGMGLYVTRMMVEQNLKGSIVSSPGESGLVTALSVPNQELPDL